MSEVTRERLMGAVAVFTNSFRIRSYEKRVCKSFRMRSYKNTRLKTL